MNKVSLALVTFILFGLMAGCAAEKTAEDNVSEENVAQENVAETRTEITEAVLVERLSKKDVGTNLAGKPKTETSLADSDASDTDSTDEAEPLRPNPFKLMLKFAGSGDARKFVLNDESEMEYKDAVKFLKEIFERRTKEGSFSPGTNEIVKEVSLDATNIKELNRMGIKVEDFEKLVDDLRKDEITDLKLEL